jgi:Asp-tRNA(Asn)/Glu-tRNA(Gln) amidotransferase A subunit family amidase
LVSLDDLRVGVVWLEDADPLVRARVEEAAAHFPQRQQVELPSASNVGALFMREVADVHRELYAEHSDLYGENVAEKIELCLAVTDAEVEAAVRARAAYRERALEAVGDLDLLVTPTLPCVPPELGLDEGRLRRRLTLFTLPFNALGWPALALPCGRAEDGLPASVQLAAPAGRDALVLAAGEALEGALRVTAAA